MCYSCRVTRLVFAVQRWSFAFRDSQHIYLGLCTFV